MTDRTIKYFELLKEESKIFLNYLKARFPLFHNSNFFFRDFHYGIKTFLELKDLKVTYPEAESLALKYSEYLENKGIFIKVNDLGWKLNYPDFVTSKPGDPL
jgi:hypothetical protein